ncbi:recombinase family protein [Streptomyces sp. NPDC056210]|uniref:recombinase family protein n=1 Tax=Streptomyces sp. NPDC056210 TaxID=3345746 RepID=UPI0035D868E4
MATKSKPTRAEAARSYDVEEEWTEADLALLADLKRQDALLPADALRALLSVRLSVFTDETTSPVRQELGLRALALKEGYRIAGVASDLNVSATKVPPWKRKALGDWLNNRTPEFDLIIFQKLDRFIRNLMDLHVMMNWSQKYEKNLVSEFDKIDLTTTAGKIMVTIIGGVAEIEAANTKVRVESLWEYAKTQESYIIGKPSYGYLVAKDEDGNNVLVFNPGPYKYLYWCLKMLRRGCSARWMVKVGKRSGLASPGLTPATLLTQLRNPALMGIRVEIDPREKRRSRRSKPVIGRDGKPIKIAEAIFEEEIFNEIQSLLDLNGKDQPPRQTGGATKFLGVLKCVDCMSNMTVHVTTNKFGDYKYLRCQKCRSGGLGAPNPDEVYAEVAEKVLSVLGDFPVEVREYAKGAKARAEAKQLEESIAYYMKELEPGGRYTRTQFTKEQAQDTVDKLIDDLAKIDPDTTKDRWVKVGDGKTFREHWQAGGIEAMARDLNRVGVTCVVTRTKVPGVRAPNVHLKLMIPKDVRDRLLIRKDDFTNEF